MPARKVNVQDYRGFSPLMLAAANDRANPETVKLLLAHNADKQPKTRAGETASEWAARFADPAVMRELGSNPKELSGNNLKSETTDVRAQFNAAFRCSKRRRPSSSGRPTVSRATNNRLPLSLSARPARRESPLMRS
jgi:ankyrin repeat protein